MDVVITDLASAMARAGSSIVGVSGVTP